MDLCALCSNNAGILWIAGTWFCTDCAWKNELLSGAEEDAWFAAEAAAYECRPDVDGLG